MIDSNRNVVIEMRIKVVGMDQASANLPMLGAGMDFRSSTEWTKYSNVQTNHFTLINITLIEQADTQEKYPFTIIEATEINNSSDLSPASLMTKHYLTTAVLVNTTRSPASSFGGLLTKFPCFPTAAMVCANSIVRSHGHLRV
ncbi:MAG: hypothetical protein V1845_00030 [bacterium]